MDSSNFFRAGWRYAQLFAGDVLVRAALRPSEKCWEYFFEDSEPGGFKDFLPAILFQFRPVMTLRNKGSLASSQGFVAAARASRTFEPLVRESVAGTCHPLFCTSEIRVKQNIQKHIDTCLQQKTTLHANMKFVSEQTLRRKTDRSGTSSQVGWLKIIHNHQTCCCALSPSSCVCWTHPDISGETAIFTGQKYP